MDLVKLKAEVEQLRAYACKGQPIAPRVAIHHVVDPLLDLIEMSMAGTTGRWWTLTELMNESEKSRNYFEKPLGRLNGKSRLQSWREAGLADLAEQGEEGGVWLINPVVMNEIAACPAADAHPQRDELTAFEEDLFE